MKTIIVINRMALLFFGLVIATANGFAQNKTEAQLQQKYRLYITKNENGNKEVIDKIFTSKEELDAYIKENKIEMPEDIEPGDLPSLQSGNEKPSGKHASKKITKKITIIEKDGSKVNGKTKMEIISDDLTPDDRAQIEQEALNIKDADVEMIVVNKIGKEKVEQTETASTQIPVPTAVTEARPNKEDNISNLKLYPNPNNGQFNIEFKVSRPADVKLQVTDLQGKEVYAEMLKNYSGRYEKSISNSELSGGTYIMNVEAGGEKKLAKIVMQ